jgi:hypothetical protein
MWKLPAAVVQTLHDVQLNFEKLGYALLASSPGTRIVTGGLLATFPGGQSFADVTLTTNFGHGASAAGGTTALVFEVPCIVEWLSASGDANHEKFRVRTVDGSNPAAGVQKSVGVWATG